MTDYFVESISSESEHGRKLETDADGLPKVH